MTQHKPALQEDAGPFALDDAEDMLINVGEVAPLLNCDTVAAVCTRVDATPRELRRWSSEDKKRYSIYFWFVVADPVEYQDVELMMYCRWNRHWREKGLDYRSKLWRVACIAAGQRLSRKSSFELRSLFVGKMFRCKLTRVGKMPSSYSIIETLIEKVTG